MNLDKIPSKLLASVRSILTDPAALTSNLEFTKSIQKLIKDYDLETKKEILKYVNIVNNKLLIYKKNLNTLWVMGPNENLYWVLHPSYGCSGSITFPKRNDTLYVFWDGFVFEIPEEAFFNEFSTTYQPVPKTTKDLVEYLQRQLDLARQLKKQEEERGL